MQSDFETRIEAMTNRDDIRAVREYKARTNDDDRDELRHGGGVYRSRSSCDRNDHRKCEPA